MATSDPSFYWPKWDTILDNYFYQKHPRFRIRTWYDNVKYSFSLSGVDSSGNFFFHWLPSGTQWNQCPQSTQIIDIQYPYEDLVCGNTYTLNIWGQNSSGESSTGNKITIIYNSFPKKVTRGQLITSESIRELVLCYANIARWYDTYAQDITTYFKGVIKKENLTQLSQFHSLEGFSIQSSTSPSIADYNELVDYISQEDALYPGPYIV